MSQPKAVVALNGFLGDRRGHLDVGELVNARAIMAGVPFYTRSRGGPEHGGWKPFAKRRLRRWIAAKLSADYDLVFVGKSFGAHWILDFLDAPAPTLLMHSHALLFDPAHSLTRGEGKVRTLPFGFTDRITVVRQTGFRSGYRVSGARDVVIKAKHKDIESRRPALLELHSFLDCHLGRP